MNWLRCRKALWCFVAGLVICRWPLEGSTERSAHLMPSLDPDWPQFRGPHRDGISNERGLLQHWPETGPRLVWSATNLGQGFSAPVIAKGRIYLTGDVRDELHLFAMDLGGKQLWRSTNGAAWRSEYPGARASANYSENRIYHQNAHGRVTCVDAETGREIWSAELLKRFGGQNITRGLSECLLVDEGAVFATAGGREALLVALDKRTGAVLWKSVPLTTAGNTENDRAIENASYASPILVRFANRRLLIGCSARHLFCADADSGRLYWTRPFPTAYSVLAMMPTLVGDAIFMTAPHGQSGGLYRLLAPAQPDGPIGVEEVWKTRLDTCQGGVVHTNGKLFGSFYSSRKG
ncbi:MAG: hypothetical protein FJ403_05965 [Verrucomicrobia bacterium]|nr:hypothetical protein [Verrucomicrobiota bacterium]